MSVCVQEVDLLKDLSPPVLTGPQSQGDLMIIPWPKDVCPSDRTQSVNKAVTLVSKEVVLTGDNGHEHALSPSVGVRWHAYDLDSSSLGTLVVEDGAVAVLGHIEHGDSYIGPGVYVIRRQREQADEIRMLAD